MKRSRLALLLAALASVLAIVAVGAAVLQPEWSPEETERILAWLEREKKIPADTPVRDVPLTPRFSELSFLHVAAWTFDAMGLSSFARRIEDWGAVQAVERLNLDGLLALWHPSGSN